MKRQFACLSIGFAALSLVAVDRDVHADTLLLKNGGELRGELQPLPAGADQKAAVARERLTMKTTTGAIVTIARDEVDELIRRRPVLEDYETRRRAAPDTVEGQWNLAEWCRSKSLSKERAASLTRLLDLDPDHVAAHRGLGHVRNNGRWTTQEELMTSRGYVKYKGRFVLPQELALIESDEHDDAASKAWYKRIKMWENWLDSDRIERKADGLRELQAIRDNNAVAALVRNFKDNPNEQKRLLYVSILSRIDGGKPLIPLAQQSLRDESGLVRAAAVRGARQKDAAAARDIYLRGLKSESNTVVNRAATALGEIGDETVVPQLIEALVTRHRYTTTVAEPSIAFSTNGSMASGGVALPPQIAGMLATGQLPYGVQIQDDGLSPRRVREVTIEKDEENPSVLSSLNALTGEDFGFDEQSWRNWQKARAGGSLRPKSKSKPRSTS